MISPKMGCLHVEQVPLLAGFSLSMVFICEVRLFKRASKSSPFFTAPPLELEALDAGGIELLGAEYDEEDEEGALYVGVGLGGSGGGGEGVIAIDAGLELGV
jgi:hypothetical protein